MGRLWIPGWSVALGAILVGAAAGQAVGPVLSGSVTGTAGVTAEQAILLSGADTKTVDSLTSSSITASAVHDDALAVINDEGTSFTAAFEMHVGDTFQTLRLTVTNASNDDGNALLTLEVPEGLDVEVNDETVGGTDSLDEAQYGANTWLLLVKAGSDDRLNITIEPKDDAAPGFYVISGSIVQISG